MNSPKFQVFEQGYWKTNERDEFVPGSVARCSKLATAKRMVRNLPVVAVVMVDGKVVHEHVPS